MNFSQLFGFQEGEWGGNERNRKLKKAIFLVVLPHEREKNKASSFSPGLDRHRRLRRVVLRKDVEGPPRGRAEDPRVRRRPAAALAHREVGDGDEGHARALDDGLVRHVELGGVRGVGRGLAGRRGRGRRGRGVELGVEQGGKRRRI